MRISYNDSIDMAVMHINMLRSLWESLGRSRSEATWSAARLGLNMIMFYLGMSGDWQKFGFMMFLMMFVQGPGSPDSKWLQMTTSQSKSLQMTGRKPLRWEKSIDARFHLIRRCVYDINFM